MSKEPQTPGSSPIEKLPGPSKPSKFADQQAHFVEEYVKDFNATRAYIAAGYSEIGATAGASRLLARVSIRNAVNKILDARFKEMSVTSQRVLAELARIAFSNVLDYMSSDENGDLRLDFSKLNRETASALAEIKEDTTGGSNDGERKLVVRTTVKQYDKLKALDLLGKYLGIFKENIQIDVNVSIAESVRQARQRLAVASPIECLPQKKTA